MKSRIRCVDSSNIGNQRVLVIAEVDDEKDTLAFYPERASHETVWIKKDDVATLVDKLNQWVKKRGGKAYPVPAVSGDL